MSAAEMAARLYPSAPGGENQVAGEPPAVDQVAQVLYPRGEGPNNTRPLPPRSDFVDQESARLTALLYPNSTVREQAGDDVDPAEVATAEQAIAAAKADAEADSDESDEAQPRGEIAPELLGEVARALDVPADEARELLDKLGPVFGARQQAVRDAWGRQAKTDKELGAGRGFDANLRTAQQAVARFGTPELRKLLNETGLGDHPEMIRAFYRASFGSRPRA